MALQKCHECGHDVSSTAKKCPNCGAAVKHKMPKGCAAALGIFGAFIVVMMGLGMITKSCEDRKIEKDRIQNEKILANEEAKRKDTFIKDIDTKYQNLIFLFQSKNIEETNKVLMPFRKYGQLDYKDVKDIDKKVSICLLEKSVMVKKPENYNANLLTYKRLFALAPDSQLYKKELEFYQGKIAERKKIETEKTRLATAKEKKRLERFGQPPENSAWDGSVYCVKQYLKSVAKDPDSLVFEKWGQVAYNDKDGWIVWCDFRGKNSFGGYTRDIKWFVIRHNNVVAVKDFSAYR